MSTRRPMSFSAAAAFVSAGAMVVFFSLQQFGGLIAEAVPGIDVPMQLVFLFSLWLAVAALAALVVGLDRVEQGSGVARVSRIAWVATIVAVVMPGPLLAGGLLGVRDLLPISYTLVFAGTGATLVAHNVDARRAGLVRGFLPWLGAIVGVGYVIAGLGFGASVISMDLFLAGYNVLIPSEVLYVAWAIGIGLHNRHQARLAPAIA